MNTRPNPSVECEWESGALGLSEEHAVAASEELELEVDQALAMKLISIRLPVSMIDDLKFIASREGMGYQPLIRCFLERFIAGEFKRIALDKMAEVRNHQSNATIDDQSTQLKAPRVACG